MIISIRVNNALVFRNNVELSLKADMRTKKFGYNVYKDDNNNILKSVGVYGPNNVGKTSLLKCIRAIKSILLNGREKLDSNIFNESDIVELGVTFLEKGEKYSFDIKYDSKEEEYLYEKFVKHIIDEHKNEKEEVLLLKDTLNKKYESIANKLEDIIKVTSKKNILINLLDSDEIEEIVSIKDTLTSFANKIEYVDMNNIPNEKTISLLKMNSELKEKIVAFIINADLDMDNFAYLENISTEIKGDEKAEEKILNLPNKIIDQMKLVSYYKGKAVPSFKFDSTGTKKIIALSSYIIEALEEGKILVVDELDSSIHFKLARSIVSMFNNEININSQLIFSVHDINLMDCKRLFRKEQIWFVHKSEEEIYLYSLSDFTAEDGIRSDTDIIEKYKKGILGAIPEPTFIDTLLGVRKNG